MRYDQSQERKLALINCNKLIRDRIPEIIKANRQTPIIYIANDNLYYSKLLEELVEETREYLQSHNPEELIDILEVIYAIAKTKNLTKEDLERLRLEKIIERGSFDNKMILERIE